MRHTIVIEIPDEVAEANQRWADENGAPAVADLPGYMETVVTGAVQRATFHVARTLLHPTVIEYHHEQMTEPDDG